MAFTHCFAHGANTDGFDANINFTIILSGLLTARSTGDSETVKVPTV